MGRHISKHSREEIGRDYETNISKRNAGDQVFNHLSVEVGVNGCTQAPVNRSTQQNGIGNLGRNLSAYMNQGALTSFDKSMRSTGVSRIPVAVWRANTLPGSSVVAKYKEEDRECKDIQDDGSVTNNGSANEKRRKCPRDELNTLRGESGMESLFEEDQNETPALKGISYTVEIGKENAKSKPSFVQQTKPSKQPIFNQADRLRAAEINRQEYLESKARLARLYDAKQYEARQRRLNMTAELQDKCLRKQKHREISVRKDVITKRLEAFCMKIAIRKRFSKSDTSQK